MPSLSDLPALNATLNGIAGLFLLSGYYFIRRRQIARHRVSMIGAFATSTLFLISYLTILGLKFLALRSDLISKA